MKEIQEKQAKELEAHTEQLIKEQNEEQKRFDEETRKQLLLDTIVSSYKKLTKEQKMTIKEVLSNNGVTKLQELPLQALEDITKHIQ